VLDDRNSGRRTEAGRRQNANVIDDMRRKTEERQIAQALRGLMTNAPKSSDRSAYL
jgi:hypothetical protein